MLQLKLFATALLLAPCLAQKTSQTVVGDRKIGLVIDESNSMVDTDPNNTRIDAALALNEYLISAAEKSATQLPDVVTVVGFHDRPDLLYPLGDPQGAGDVIRNISSTKSGTFIGGGIDSAINETTKQGTGTTANRTGIVVLTDGNDNTSGRLGTQGTIAAILRAGSLGIRVSFGFLRVGLLAQQDARILLECLKTGGTFASFSDPSSLKNFVEQVELQGLTNKDGQGVGAATQLLPGLVTSGILSPNGNILTYAGRANEVLNFTVSTANLTVPLQAVLRDPVKNTELSPRQATNRTGIAVVETTLKQDTNVELRISANGTYGETIFNVGVNSSLGLSAGRVEKKNAGGRLVVEWSLGLAFLGALVALL